MRYDILNPLHISIIFQTENRKLKKKKKLTVAHKKLSIALMYK